MKRNIDFYLSLAAGALGLISFAVSMVTRDKMDEASGRINSVCTAMDTTVENLVKRQIVDIPEEMVKTAVENTVPAMCKKAFDKAVTSTVAEYKYDISTKVEKAIAEQKKELSNAVLDTIREKCSKIDISDLTKQVTKELHKDAAKKFDSEMNDILNSLRDDKEEARQQIEDGVDDILNNLQDNCDYGVYLHDRYARKYNLRRV